MEKNRLEATAGYLFMDFNTTQDFKMALEYAKELGWVLWESESKRMFFVRTEGKASVVEFITRKNVQKSGS